MMGNAITLSLIADNIEFLEEIWFNLDQPSI